MDLSGPVLLADILAALPLTRIQLLTVRTDAREPARTAARGRAAAGAGVRASECGGCELPSHTLNTLLRRPAFCMETVRHRIRHGVLCKTPSRYTASGSL
jgi:hypothetical protein